MIGCFVTVLPFETLFESKKRTTTQTKEKSGRLGVQDVDTFQLCKQKRLARKFISIQTV